MNLLTYFAYNPHPSNDQELHNSCALFLMEQTAAGVQQHVYQNLHRLISCHRNMKRHDTKPIKRTSARSWIEEQQAVTQLLFDDMCKGAKKLLKGRLPEIDCPYDRNLIRFLDINIGRFRRNQLIEAIAYDTLVQANLAI